MGYQITTNSGFVPFSLFLACEELKSRSISFIVVCYIMTVLGVIDWGLGMGWEQASFYIDLSHSLTVATVDLQSLKNPNCTHACDGEGLDFVGWAKRKRALNQMIQIILKFG